MPPFRIVASAVSRTRLTLSKLEQLLLAACDGLRGSMDASECAGLGGLAGFDDRAALSGRPAVQVDVYEPLPTAEASP